MDEIVVAGFEPAGDGGLVVRVLDTGADSWFALPAEALAARRDLVDAALTSDARDGSGYARIGDVERDGRAAINEANWASLARWDREHVADVLALRAGDGRAALLAPGWIDELPEFSVRRARRQAFLDRRLDGDGFLRHTPVSLWHPSGVLPLLDRLTERGLPALDPSRMTLVLLPFPDPFLAALGSLAARRPDRAARLLEQARPGDHQSYWTDDLRARLRDAARRAGAEVLEDLTGAAFAEVLARRFPPDRERWLVVFGHQDGSGIHCSDGPVPVAALAPELLSTRSSGRTYTSADLMICDAHRPTSLAPLLQAAGCLVVTCRGRYGYFAAGLAGWLAALRTLIDDGPCSLPDLHERVWLRAQGTDLRSRVP